MKKFGFILVGIVFLFTSCTQKDTFDKSKAQDHLIMSVLWYQRSTEMRALYYQCFNWAKLRVEMDLLKNPTKTRKAVIVDIDETMLNNSPFETNCINTGKSYSSESWKNWTFMENAEALPGAVEFSKFAETKGVEVFYISNRKVDEFDVTLKNLQKEGFAFADSSHLILKTTTSDKTVRRNIVKKDHEIILLIGDSMGDFDNIFENRKDDYGFSTVDANKKMFGDKYIVLPNPMYGAWEKAVLDFKKGLSDEEKYNLRKKKLIAY